MYFVLKKFLPEKEKHLLIYVYHGGAKPHIKNTKDKCILVKK